jgi:hypothetical protein
MYQKNVLKFQSMNPWPRAISTYMHVRNGVSPYR